MIINRIEKRLAEEKIVSDYIKMLEDVVENLDGRLSQMFAKVNKNGKWDNKELAKYNRATKLRRQITAEIIKYKNGFYKSLRDELAATYQGESLFTQEYLTANFNMEFSKLPTQAIKTSVLDTNKIAGKTMEEYLDKFGEDLAFRVHSDIFQGIALGEGPRKVTRRMADSVALGQHRAATTVRSWYNKTLNAATFDTYDQAGIEKALYLATLDDRTTAICISRHNKTYTVEEIRAMLPAHYNCRSTGAPIVPGAKQEKANSYESWILDGRRSEEQLLETKDKIVKAYKVNEISKKDRDRFVKVVDQALKNVS